MTAARLTLFGMKSAFLRSAGLLGLTQAAASLFGLATTVIWARYMPVELFGEFRVALSIVIFISAFCLQGTSQAATMSAAQGKDGNLRLLVRAKLKANMLGALALLVTAGYYAWGPNASMTIALGLVAAAICFPAYNFTDMWLSWINGKGRMDALAAGRLINSFLGLAATAAAALLQLHALWVVLAIFLAVQMLQNMLVLAREMRLAKNGVEDASLVSYGHHATIAMTFSSLLTLDVVLLDHFYDSRQVAIYALALQFPQQLKTLTSIFGQVLTPRIQSAGNVAQAWLEVRRQFWLITALLAVIGIIGYFAMPFVMVFFFSDAYADAVAHSSLLWLCLALTGSTSYLGSALLLTKRPVFVYMPIVGFALLSLALYFLLMPFGVAGMIWARVGAMLALSLFYLVGFLYCRAEAQAVGHE